MIDFAKIGKYKENNRIEAKKAVGGLPHSIWETYSAFANTIGGIILLGVEEYKDKSFHPVVLPDPERLIDEFWNIVRNTSKVSVNVLSEGDVTVEEIDGKRIVAIRVPRARPCDRPVYIGEGDYKCTREEVEDMLRKAAAKPRNKKVISRDGSKKMTLKTLNHKRAVVSYLTENISAKSREIAELLGLKSSRAREILAEMADDGVIVAEGEGRSRIYRLKA